MSNNKSQLSKHDYDILLSGSDQIWNPVITGSDSSFMFAFEKDNKIKKFAYSSSFGMSDITSTWSSIVKKNLKDFERIGLREEDGYKIVSSILPKADIDIVLDPVFLLDSYFWSSISSPELTPSSRYVLVYSLESNPKIIEQAIELSKANNLKIVAIHPFSNSFSFADICINEAGPLEFISLIKNAEYVVTNSFHGTAFSIIFEKDFYCIPHSKTGSRMLNLLSRISLYDDQNSCKDQNIFIKSTEDSKNLLKSYINDSKSFLKL